MTRREPGDVKVVGWAACVSVCTYVYRDCGCRCTRMCERYVPCVRVHATGACGMGRLVGDVGPGPTSSAFTTSMMSIMTRSNPLLKS